MHPGHAALAVGQYGGCDEEAKAAGHGTEPAQGCRVRIAVVVRIYGDALDGCAVEHALDADHEVRCKLIVAADLPAADYATRVQAAFVFAGDKAVKRELRMGPAAAKVAAEIAPYPTIDGRRCWPCLNS